MSTKVTARRAAARAGVGRGVQRVEPLPFTEWVISDVNGVAMTVFTLGDTPPDAYPNARKLRKRD